MVTSSPNKDIGAVLSAANGIILGKERQIRMALACLLARGHLLIEDVPGVGKTTLAHLLAKLLGRTAGGTDDAGVFTDRVLRDLPPREPVRLDARPV